MTYADLKRFLDGLTPEQLQQDARVIGVETPGGYVTQAEVMKEDWINPSGEGVEPVSVYREYADPDFVIEDEEVIYAKGEVFLTFEGAKP